MRMNEDSSMRNKVVLSLTLLLAALTLMISPEAFASVRRKPDGHEQRRAAQHAAVAEEQRE